MKKGGQLVSYNEMMNTANLGNNKSYQAFDFNRYKNNVKISNFAGGAAKKKMKNILKDTYVEYRKGNKSFIRKLRGGAELDQLTVPLADTRNTSGLQIPKPYEYIRVQRLSSVPHSHLASN